MHKRLLSALLSGTIAITALGTTLSAAPSEKSLKDAFAANFKIGNIMEPGQVNNSVITDMFKHHYNVVTAENAMKPANLTMSKDNYYFGNADSIVNWAKNNGIDVHGHTLVWHSQSANWLAGTPSNPLTRAEAKTNMENYINAVAGHFKGKVISWDVVNEAFLNSVSNGSNWKNVLRTSNSNDGSAWYMAYANGADTSKGESGADYIYDAFVFARIADPGAKLYYNDYNETETGKRNAIANMVTDLNNKWKTDARNTEPERLLIEGIGMQSHYYTQQFGLLSDVEATIQRFAATGADIAVSELDVPVGTWQNYKTRDKEAADEQNQADVYEELFKIYNKYKDNISRITFWGKADNESWRREGNPLPFGQNYTPKLAYSSIIALAPEDNGNPGGENPGGENPGGENPGGENPGGENPGGESPGGENPGGENPGGENPGGENPGGENPGGESPGGENPGGENPGGENPGGENPGGENPGGGNPGGENPGGENPGGGNPGGGNPGGENPEGGDNTGDDNNTNGGGAAGGGGAATSNTVSNTVSKNTVTVKEVNAGINSQGTAAITANVGTDAAKIKGETKIRLDDDTLLTYVNNKNAKKLQISVIGAADDDTVVIVGKDVINKAKSLGKNVTVSVKDNSGKTAYTWTVTANDKTKAVADASLSVAATLSANDKAVNKALSGVGVSETGMAVSFEKNLPKSANVRIDVSALVGSKSNIKKNQTVYLYKYNEKSGKFEQTVQNRLKVSDTGTITITNVENEKYVLLPSALDSKSVKLLTSQVVASVSKSALKKGNSTTIKIAAPQGLEIVKKIDPDNKKLQAVISYSTSDSSVASVNSTGKITFKESGKVTITIKREFSNGKTTTAKLNLTVGK